MAIARHLFVDIHELGTKPDSTLLKEILIRCADACGATQIGSLKHDFSGGGGSALLLVAESHFSLHTWPEHDYAAFDAFSCGTIDLKASIATLEAQFPSSRIELATLDRGRLRKPGL